MRVKPYTVCQTYRASEKAHTQKCGGSDLVKTKRTVCAKCPLFKPELMEVPL
jgi:hypothetical protein